MEGKAEFRALPWYNGEGDCIIYQIADEAFVARRIDELLTIYNSVVDNKTIGFQIKGVHAIIKKIGLDALSVMSENEAHQIKSISITALLLLAYEGGPRTINRRRGYASAFDCPSEQPTIDASAIEPPGSN
jgi:hypothetical protein